jgi:CspA family cold shock protein
LARFPPGPGKISLSFLLDGLRLAGGLPVFIEKANMSDISSGTVKWFNDAKGFGFITPSNGGEDLFAHFKEIQGDGFKTLKEGQRVEYRAARGPKGMQATQIRPL